VDRGGPSERESESGRPLAFIPCGTRARRAGFGAGVHAKLVAAGAHFAARPEDPVQIFRDNGYVESACIPTFARAAELGVLWERARIPRPIAWLLGHVLVKDLHGYAVYRLDHGR
jgi:hypothetical protein